MASTFKFHSQVNETVPWQAQYTFPTQATKVNKQVVKLPPKNGQTFAPGSIVRIEFPADNYLNALNSVLALDITPTAVSPTYLRLQRQGAHCAIKRLRILYGSLVLEDIQEYSTLVRIFTEAGVQSDYFDSLGGILDGMYDTQTGGNALVGNNQPTSYCLNLLSGLLTCKKLIPLKWMAAQLAIELTLGSGEETLITDGTNPSYSVTNVNFIAEMLEFDSTYDTAFYAGLVQGGVPLKFSSWHYHTSNVVGSNTSVQIHERSRSVKAGFAVLRQNTVAANLDKNFFFNSISSAAAANGTITASNASIVQEFQWRVGGRYYPSQPVSCVRGGPEALVELLKCMDALGDYRMASNIYPTSFSPSGGGGQNFIMASEFENTDVMPDSIAGINAEEQSDINLTIKTAAGVSGANGGFRVEVFMHYDCLLIVRDGNVVDLVM
jgi:hypothetical protein